jgi:hypothetical protein
MFVVTGGNVSLTRCETAREQRPDALLVLRVVSFANYTRLELDLATIGQVDTYSRPKDPIFEYGMNCFHGKPQTATFQPGIVALLTVDH